MVEAVLISVLVLSYLVMESKYSLRAGWAKWFWLELLPPKQEKK
jgi:hypothetical protein